MTTGQTLYICRDLHVSEIPAHCRACGEQFLPELDRDEVSAALDRRAGQIARALGTLPPPAPGREAWDHWADDAVTALEEHGIGGHDVTFFDHLDATWYVENVDGEVTVAGWVSYYNDEGVQLVEIAPPAHRVEFRPS